MKVGNMQEDVYIAGCARTPIGNLSEFIALIAALRSRGRGRGIASICLGRGEALAMAVEVR